MKRGSSKEIDPITLEVVQSFLINISREMRATMTNATYSPVLSETQDFACAIISKQGELVAMSVDLPLHIFPTAFHAQLILERYRDEIYPGDVFITNDPYTGGPHLNDVLVLYPFFHNGDLLLFIATRAHWTDVGGRGGVVGQAREIYEEGLRMPTIKIYDRGEPNRALTEVIFANVRNSEEREGDFLAMVGTCKKAEVRLQELFRQHSQKTVEGCIDAILDRSERVVRDAILALPDGEYYYEEYLENTGTAPEPLPIRCKMTISGDEIVFDFNGSGHQAAGPTNSGPGCTYTGVFTMLKSYIEPATPVNGGPMRPVKVIFPKQSFLNARLPAPAGGFAEVIHISEHVVLGLLAQVMPEKVGPAPESSANHCYITGYDSDKEQHWVLYDYNQVGTPASPITDGSNTVCTYNMGDYACGVPVERVDLEQPVEILLHALRKDSGGPGYRRGGLGLEKRIKILDPAGCYLTILSEQNVIPRMGKSSGHASALNAYTVLRDGVEMFPSDIPGKVAGFHLRQGDCLVQRKHGGGGWGDPLDREVERVQDDVALGYVSYGQARRAYGVIFNNGEVDLAGTRELRGQLRAERAYIEVVESAVDEYDQVGRRKCPVSPILAAKMGLEEGDLVEYVPSLGPHLKAWARVDNSLQGGASPLGPHGRAILRTTTGQQVLVRALLPSA